MAERSNRYRPAPLTLVNVGGCQKLSSPVATSTPLDFPRRRKHVRFMDEELLEQQYNPNLNHTDFQRDDQKSLRLEKQSSRRRRTSCPGRLARPQSCNRPPTPHPYYPNFKKEKRSPRITTPFKGNPIDTFYYSDASDEVFVDEPTQGTSETSVSEDYNDFCPVPYELTKSDLRQRRLRYHNGSLLPDIPVPAAPRKPRPMLPRGLEQSASAQYRKKLQLYPEFTGPQMPATDNESGDESGYSAHEESQGEMVYHDPFSGMSTRDSFKTDSGRLRPLWHNSSIYNETFKKQEAEFRKKKEADSKDVKDPWDEPLYTNSGTNLNPFAKTDKRQTRRSSSTVDRSRRRMSLIRSPKKDEISYNKAYKSSDFSDIPLNDS